MRKMKKLFKAREQFKPWWHWSTIHLALNLLSLFVFWVAIFFIENTTLEFYWITACCIQFIPIFLIQFIAWIFERKLSKNALAIIMRKLEESKFNFKDIDISIKESKLYSCAITVNHGFTTVGPPNEFLTIIHDINRKLGNGYNIVVVSFQYQDVKQGEK